MSVTTLFRLRPGNVALTLFLLVAATARAQTEEARTLAVEGGASIAYTLRRHPAGAHLAAPVKELAPTSALDTAKLLNLHLAAGDVEEAALLSNSPRRRYEVLREYQASVGEEEFKHVFAQYLTPANQLVAEIVIDRHSLLVWDLREGANRIAGQYFVEVDGKFLVDDVPNDVRTQLRWVLEAYRSGKLAR